MKTLKSIGFVAVLFGFIGALINLAFGAIPTKPGAKPTVPTKPAAAAAKPAPKPYSALPTVTVIGRLGKDPEVKIVHDKPVCEFSLAEDVYTGEKDEHGKSIKTTIWYKVAAWNGISDRAQFLGKGQEVVVRGTLKVTSGEKREFRDITAALIRLTMPLPEAAEVPAEEELPE